MQLFKHEEVEDDILVDLMEEINELYEASEQTLIELELTPKDNELQRSLFRCVHTIKGDLGLVGFTPMILVLQHVEDLLDMLRKGDINYTSNMSDIVLLSMDNVKTFVEHCMEKGEAQYDQVMHDALVEIIAKITPSNQDEHEALLAKGIGLLDPSRQVKANTSDSSVADANPAPMVRTGIPKGVVGDKQVDLLFFRDLMKPIEKRSGYKEGRGDRIAKLAAYVNTVAGLTIAEDQLAVACYVHDFGMSFMPVDVVNKSTELTELESNLLRSHVYKSARLLEHLNQWDEARKIVMQHHENSDGSGFPMGIDGDQICDGAKLLAILDRYDRLTDPKVSTNINALSKKEAVISLNQDYKGQLSGKWLRHFNTAIMQILKN